MAKPRNNLEEQLRAAIRECGMSLTQLGDTTGVDSGRLSRFMRGERDLTLGATTKLCEALGLRLTRPSPNCEDVEATPAQAAAPSTPSGEDLRAEAAKHPSRRYRLEKPPAPKKPAIKKRLRKNS
jgi:transcriptional regulator with XRE-family HTH domain